MAGILSKGIKFEIADIPTGSTTPTYTEILNLQQIPDIGGDVDQVDVTTLANDAYQYINGLKNFGSLEFVFLYDNSSATSNYRLLKAAENVAKKIRITLPDNTKVDFDGIPHVKISGAGVNTALQFTCSIALQSDVTVTNPV